MKIRLSLLFIVGSFLTGFGQYCTGTYNNPCFNPWTTNDMIDDFWTTGGLTDISNLSSGCATSANNNYSDFTNIFLVTVPGAAITMNMQCASTGNGGPCPGTQGCFSQGFALWIDWDQNNVFDPVEKLYESPSAGYQVFTTNITVPPTATCGDYRMRVRCVWATGGATITPCGVHSFGETEDYTITITNCNSQTRTICKGDTEAIDYTNLIPPNTASVVVNPMTNVNITNFPSIISFNPPDTAAYQLTFTSPDSSWIDSVYVNVNPPFSEPFAGLDDTVCVGEFYPLAGVLDTVTTFGTWSHILPPGVNGGFFYTPNAQTLAATVTGGNPGLYQMILTETDSIGVCPNTTDTLDLLISEETHTASKIDPSCFGYADGEINITSTGTIGANEYSIDNGATFSASPIFTGLVGGTYDLISRDVKGCSFSSSITLNDPLNVVLTVSPNDTVCENGTTFVSAAAVNGNAFDFHWDFTNDLGSAQQLSPNASNSPIVFQDSIVSVYATNENNCFSDTLSIIITARPPIAAGITPNDSICPGDDSDITILAQGGYMGYTYNWTLNGQPVNFATNAQTVSPSNQTNYCVTVSDICESTPKTVCTNIIMRDVPLPTLYADTIGGCVPVTIGFHNTTSGSFTPNITSTATWLVDGRTYTDPTTIQHTFDNVGEYDVYLEVYSQYGCYADTTYEALVESYPIPVANFYVSPDPVTFFEPVVQLVNLTSGANHSYLWKMPGGSPTVSSLESPVVAYQEGIPNRYIANLTVTSEYNCVNSTQGFVNVISDVNIYAPNAFTPDGNNVNNTWRIYIVGINPYDFRLQVFNRWGEIVWESRDPEAEWDGRLANGELVQEGTYAWILTTNDITVDKRYEFDGTIYILR